MHVAFGVENPVLYALMYSQATRRASGAALAAETELRRGLEAFAAAGLLRLNVDDATALTTAMLLRFAPTAP